MARRRGSAAASGVLAAALALALALPACSAGGGTAAGQDVTLTAVGFPARDEIATVRLEEARKAIAPGRITLGSAAFDPQQFESAVAAGSPPDLVYLDRRLIGRYAAKGQLAPLTDCAAKQQINLATYRKPAVDEASRNGVPYGVPEFATARVLMINNAALKSAGLDPAGVNAGDWTRLGALATQLTRKNGDKLGRIGFDPRLPEQLPMWAQAAGVPLLDPDGRTANLTDPKLAQALEYAAGLIAGQGGPSAISALRASWDAPGARSPWLTDQVAVSLVEDGYLGVLADAAPNAEVTVLPFSGPAGGQVSWVTGYAWAITAGSRHKDQACTFVKAMTDFLSWVKAARANADARRAKGRAYTGLYTANIRADNIIFGELVKPTGNASLDAAVRAVTAVQESAGFSVPSSPAGAEVQRAWTDAVNRVLAGQQTATAALAQAQREAQQALDSAGRK